MGSWESHDWSLRAIPGQSRSMGVWKVRGDVLGKASPGRSWTHCMRKVTSPIRQTKTSRCGYPRKARSSQKHCSRSFSPLSSSSGTKSNGTWRHRRNQYQLHGLADLCRNRSLLYCFAALFTSTSTYWMVVLPMFSDVCAGSASIQACAPGLAVHVVVFPSAYVTFIVPGIVT